MRKVKTRGIKNDENVEEVKMKTMERKGAPPPMKGVDIVLLGMGEKLPNSILPGYPVLSRKKSLLFSGQNVRDKHILAEAQESSMIPLES